MYCLLWQRLILRWKDYPDGQVYCNHKAFVNKGRQEKQSQKGGDFKTRIEDESQRFKDALILALNLDEHSRRLEI